MEERPRPLRLGVIGAGWFASRRHCPDVADHPEAELVALCRRDEEQLAQMARAFAVTDTYTDYAELIGSGTVDGVIIYSPHHLHFEHARAGRQNGPRPGGDPESALPESLSLPARPPAARGSGGN